jgi:transposase-like protein
MGRHVCPICETMHAVRNDVQIGAGGQHETLESWECPSCGYSFVSVPDLATTLSSLNVSPAVEVHVATLSGVDLTPKR